MRDVAPEACGPQPDWAGRPTLGVVGFVYPGKGHDTVIDAAGRHPLRPLVVVAGTASSGHNDLLRALRLRAAERGVDLLVTGPLDDADMAAAAAAVTVPVAPASSVSASGSLATWLGCGRRPLAARGEYAADLDALYPYVLGLYTGHGELDSAVARALVDPAQTWIAGSVRWSDAGAPHAALYARLGEGRPCWCSWMPTPPRSRASWRS